MTPYVISIHLKTHLAHVFVFVRKCLSSAYRFVGHEFHTAPPAPQVKINEKEATGITLSPLKSIFFFSNALWSQACSLKPAKIKLITTLRVLQFTNEVHRGEPCL